MDCFTTVIAFKFELSISNWEKTHPLIFQTFPRPTDESPSPISNSKQYGPLFRAPLTIYNSLWQINCSWISPNPDHRPLAIEEFSWKPLATHLWIDRPDRWPSIINDFPLVEWNTLSIWLTRPLTILVDWWKHFSNSIDLTIDYRPFIGWCGNYWRGMTCGYWCGMTCRI